VEATVGAAYSAKTMTVGETQFRFELWILSVKNDLKHSFNFISGAANVKSSFFIDGSPFTQRSSILGN
jgi:hypothetical protein